VNFKFNAQLGLILGLLLLPVMVSSDSLWLDEGDTAMYALQPGAHAWWNYLRHDIAADCQMPLSMFCAWLGGRTLGTSEWQLRAINILWGALALVGMYRAGKRLQLPWLPLLLAIQPYFWFYTNEARPYALQIACGAWLLAAFTEFVGTKGTGNTWAWHFSAALFFLCLATMLAPVPVAAAVIAAAVFARLNRWQISRKAVLVLTGGVLANIPVAIYYASTLARGAKGAQLWRVDLKFFGYVAYEFTGMTGLGLPVEKIRELAHSPHLAATLTRNWIYFALPALAFLLLLSVLALGLRKRNSNLPAGFVGGCAMILCLASLVFVAVGIIIQKAFWARHFAPIFPFYVALLGVAVSRLWSNRGFVLTKLPCLLVALLLFSSLSLRFAPRHRKEDYRAAAQIARQALAGEQTVWWIAGFLPAQYYGLGYTLSAPEPEKVFCPQYEAKYEIGPAPDVIIYSKPDIFDSTGVVQKFVQQNGYRVQTTLKSFVVFTK
jgi:hypothetical protein